MLLKSTLFAEGNRFFGCRCFLINSKRKKLDIIFLPDIFTAFWYSITTSDSSKLHSDMPETVS